MTTTMTRPQSRGLKSWLPDHPLKALRQELDELWSRFSARSDGNGLAGPMSVVLDLSETDEAVQIRMDLPGMKPDDIDIQMTDRTLTVSGERKEEIEEKKRTFHRVERRVGRFSRSVTFPCRINQSNVQAEYREGVLNITLPKAEPTKTRKVKIKTTI
jgi:HSP20 family protein